MLLLLLLALAANSLQEVNLIDCHLVIFNNYMNASEHKQYLSYLLGTSGGFKILERINRATLLFPTDFALVYFENTELLQKLSTIRDVKYVLPNRRYGGEESKSLSAYSDINAFCSLNQTNFHQPVMGLLGHDMSFSATTKGRFLTNWLTDSHWSADDNNLFKDFTSMTSGRKLCAVNPHEEITDKLNAKYLWDMGYRGSGIRVAVFDTGLRQGHKAFYNVEERINYTNEKDEDDGLGHGTFVAGLIASNASECRGFAPEATLHIFKVFTSSQVSYTTWFLDAFNYALAAGINILNLSIGGPDYMDMPFVDKVRELSAHGIVIVSAIGNDGPLYGTLNNPADLECVLGVGGINDQNQIASFSSRGVTTRELTHGYGRVKPDVVTYGHKVRGTGRFQGCAVLSGTSVASPVAAGVITLLASSIPESMRWTRFNPAFIKQVMILAAERLPTNVDQSNDKPNDQTIPNNIIQSTNNIFEQGAGRIPSIDKLYAHMNQVLAQPPRASFYPTSLDMTDCPYMWPWCAQPLYYSAQPMIVNVTVLNPVSSWSRFCKPPQYIPSIKNNGKALEIDLSDYSIDIKPWSGHVGVKIKVSQKYRLWEGIAQGKIIARICAPGEEDYSEIPTEFTDDESINKAKESQNIIELMVRIRIIHTPLRRKRILWSQYHNVQYPMGYIPRDNLNHKENILDWNGDHPHTNFRSLFQHLIKSQYYVELLVNDLTTFDARLYGTLLLIDTEEEYTAEERRKLQHDVEKLGLGVAIFSDWYNIDVMREIRFFDDNTKTTWHPLTGGSNVPALNALLDPYGIVLGDRIYDGEITAIYTQQQNHDQDDQGDKKLLRATYGSGTSIVKFPRGGTMIRFPLKDQSKELLKQQGYSTISDAPVLGFIRHERGRIAIFGDSNCLDDVNQPIQCMWLVDRILQFTSHDQMPNNKDGIVFAKFEVLDEEFIQSGVKLPERVPGVTVSPKVPLQNLIHARPLHNITRYIGRKNLEIQGLMLNEAHDHDGVALDNDVIYGVTNRRLRLMIPVVLMFLVLAFILYITVSRRHMHKMTRESRLRV
jgi:membrane-bound transcription factor site-1 protease